ncbi:MAG TPA: helix-hairpin-helix domain-containing protein [Verrucomicrobiae bacterium]|jgi:type II secretory pathway component PulK
MNTRLANKNSRRASVLIIVMWVAFGLVSITLYYAHSMMLQLKAADNRTASLEANQAIEGAALYVSNVLANRINSMTTPAVGNFKAEAVRVGNAKFWIIGRDTNDLQTSLQSETPVWGLVDEAGKVNLNYVAGSNFQNLPNMTVNTAAAMFDWRTPTNTPSTGGAKSETYSTLQPPYLSKNAPYETIDELRLVYGLNLDILFGEDANLNGALDPNENDGMKLAPSDNQNGILDPGVFEYVTTWSHESNLGTNGITRVVVTNLDSLTQLVNSNFPDLKSYLTAFSGTGGGGGAGGGRGGGGGAAGGRGGAATAAAAGAPTSVLDFYIRSASSGMSQSQFQEIEPYLVNPSQTGMIDINTATATALACVPGIGSNMAPQVLSYRQSNPPQSPTISWLVTAMENNQAALEAAGPYVTAYSFQFAADIAAVGHNNRGFRRVRFVFDCSSGTPLIVYRQDLTHLGWALGKKLHDQLLAQNTK